MSLRGSFCPIWAPVFTSIKGQGWIMNPSSSESTFTPTDLPVQVHTAHQDMCICSLILPLGCHRGSRPGSWLLEGEGEPPAILP